MSQFQTNMNPSNKEEALELSAFNCDECKRLTEERGLVTACEDDQHLEELRQASPRKHRIGSER